MELSLSQKLEVTEEELDKKRKEFENVLKKELENIQQVVSDSNIMKSKFDQLEGELSKVRQEKESLSLELSLKQAQFEAS
ncbi:hypothetical protein, partial [Salmonella sp. s55004]|uniref:hypothetical protein n=1 Tax=Salmonella sp. s55004 TaxID=3159675 RepID=UPI0039810FE1